uniref:ATP synthase F0 subunit 8 n=1 Tax=Raeta sp. TaxID=3067663 RepID=A0AA50A8Q9_9BIVA|nr:ATP synthase F0 subunit 8 [Raeta sp.]
MTSLSPIFVFFAVASIWVTYLWMEAFLWWTGKRGYNF